MNVSIGKLKIKNGHSLFLDYYLNGKRQKEYLQLHLIEGNIKENRDTMLLAERIRALKEVEIKSETFKIIPVHKKKLNFFLFAQHFIEGYNKADHRIYRAVVACFKRYLSSDNLPCASLSPKLCKDFNEHLQHTLNGETPFNYFKAFKRMLKAATEDHLFDKNPCDGIRSTNHRQNELTKQVLMDEEIQLLAATPCGNEQVKRAFLFSTQTGLRKCDIVRLQWKDVHLNLADPYITFRQTKTDRGNTIPLNENALALLGTPGVAFSYVFDLKETTNGINKVIKNWVKRAGIDKHITYHCARHSCGTNLLIHGVDLKTTSMTLGHSSTRTTEKYTHISDAMKQRAVNKLPAITF